MLVAIEASDLPGRRIGAHANVHVGQCFMGKRADVEAVLVRGRPWRMVGVAPADAPRARWECEVTVKDGGAAVDFGGPFVQGGRDDRHLGLAWVEPLADGSMEPIGGVKLRGDVEPDAPRAGREPGVRLVARLGLTGPGGGPRYARVRPPDVAWVVEPV